MIVTSRDLMLLVSILLIVLLSIASRSDAQEVKPPANDAKKREPIEVQIDDISRGQVQIIGKMGHPLGQFVSVRGTWEPPATSKPDSSPTFVVDQVNGRRLDAPVEFTVVEPVSESIKDAAFATRELGTLWELRAVESGGFEGFRDEVWQELGLPPSSHKPRGFITKLYYTKVKRILATGPRKSAVPRKNSIQLGK
jgi:hypothetical protein